MSDDLVLDEHRPAADATRPLQVGKPLIADQRFRGLSAELFEHGEPRECWSVRYVRYLQSIDAPSPLPPHCRRLIQPGDHYILWTEHDRDSRPTGRSEAYCASCAIAEWEHAEVREVTL